MTIQLREHFSKHIKAVEKSVDALEGPVASARKALSEKEEKSSHSETADLQRKRVTSPKSLSEDSERIDGRFPRFVWRQIPEPSRASRMISDTNRFSCGRWMRSPIQVMSQSH